MAKFFGSLRGRTRTTITRTGFASTGMKTTCFGWEAGVEVHAEYDQSTGRDVFHVYATKGSNHPNTKRHIADVIQTSEGVAVRPIRTRTS